MTDDQRIHAGCGQPWHLCSCCDKCDEPKYLCWCSEGDDEDDDQ